MTESELISVSHWGMFPTGREIEIPDPPRGMANPYRRPRPDTVQPVIDAGDDAAS